MRNHLLLPGLQQVEDVAGLYRDALAAYLQQVVDQAEKGVVSSSGVVSGYISQVLTGSARVDWLAIMKDLLEVDGTPLAYSEAYGKQLSTFAAQWRQTDVHAVYARFWVETNLTGTADLNYLTIIKKFVRPDGWIFNPEVSDTGVGTRMRAELFMQLAMGLDLALTLGDRPEEYASSLAALVSMGLTGYVSAEFFRYRALQFLGHPEQMAAGIPKLLEECRVEPGFADLNVASKRDDYMGTVKRSSRDVAPYSAVCTVYAIELAAAVKDEHLDEWRKQLAAYIRKNPLQIKPFKMRDLEPAFGSGLTAYEVAAEAILLAATNS